MTGLKTYLPVLARHLNTTADVLYERQRHLTRGGFLVATAGRGPGSGIRVTPPVVAKVVMAMLATDNRSDVGGYADFLSNKLSDLERCPLTGAATFGNALELIFASESLASRVHKIEVMRSDLRGQIFFDQKGKRGAPQVSSFGKEIDAVGLQSSCWLPGADVLAITKEIAEIVAREK